MGLQKVPSQPGRRQTRVRSALLEDIWLKTANQGSFHTNKGHVANDSKSGKTKGAATERAAPTGEKQGSGTFKVGSFEWPCDLDSLDLLVDSGCNGSC